MRILGKLQEPDSLVDVGMIRAFVAFNTLAYLCLLLLPRCNMDAVEAFVDLAAKSVEVDLVETMVFRLVHHPRQALNVRSIGWLGVRTAQARAMYAFCRDVLGMRVLQDRPEAVRFAPADGTEAHVYGLDDREHEYLGSSPIVGFLVDSFDQTRVAMTRAKVEILYPEPQHQGARVWQHFRARDGNSYEIIAITNSRGIDGTQ